MKLSKQLAAAVLTPVILSGCAGLTELAENAESKVNDFRTPDTPEVVVDKINKSNPDAQVTLSQANAFAQKCEAVGQTLYAKPVETIKPWGPKEFGCK